MRRLDADCWRCEARKKINRNLVDRGLRHGGMTYRASRLWPGINQGTTRHQHLQHDPSRGVGGTSVISSANLRRPMLSSPGQKQSEARECPAHTNTRTEETFVPGSSFRSEVSCTAVTVCSLPAFHMLRRELRSEELTSQLIQSMIMNPWATHRHSHACFALPRLWQRAPAPSVFPCHVCSALTWV